MTRDQLIAHIVLLGWEPALDIVTNPNYSDRWCCVRPVANEATAGVVWVDDPTDRPRYPNDEPLSCGATHSNLAFALDRFGLSRGRTEIPIGALYLMAIYIADRGL